MRVTGLDTARSDKSTKIYKWKFFIIILFKRIENIWKLFYFDLNIWEDFYTQRTGLYDTFNKNIVAVKQRVQNFGVFVVHSKYFKILPNNTDYIWQVLGIAFAPFFCDIVGLNFGLLNCMLNLEVHNITTLYPMTYIARRRPLYNHASQA
jgi:hypothetical protein